MYCDWSFQLPIDKEMKNKVKDVLYLRMGIQFIHFNIKKQRRFCFADNELI